jgi:polar amino acid transport system substrate-binding protein
MPMMRRLLPFLFAALLSLPAAATDLSLYTEEAAPLSMTHNGRLRGVATDLLRAAFAEAGLSYDIAVLARRRAFDQALSHGNGCVYPLNRTEEREQLFRWVGPLAKGGWALFAKADNPLELRALEDAKPLRVGAAEGDAISQFLKDRGFAPVEVSATNADEINIRKLSSDRIDLWATGSMRATYVAAQFAIPIRKVLQFKDVAVFMGCNREIAAATVETLNAIIRRHWEDGSIEEFSRAYR